MSRADGARTLRLTIPDDVVVAVAARANSEGVTTSEFVIRVLSKELLSKEMSRPASLDGLQSVRTIGDA